MENTEQTVSLSFNILSSSVLYSSHSLISLFRKFSGRFLCSMLEIVMRWHGDKKTYEKVAVSSPAICVISPL